MLSHHSASTGPKCHSYNASSIECLYAFKLQGYPKEKHPHSQRSTCSHIGPPIVLYEEIFGRFLDDLKNETLAIDDTVISNTLDIIRTAAELYDLEKDPIQAMNNVLTKYAAPSRASTTSTAPRSTR